MITKKLQKSVTNFANFSIEENTKLVEEENKLIGNECDVVLKGERNYKEEFLLKQSKQNTPGEEGDTEKSTEGDQNQIKENKDTDEAENKQDPANTEVKTFKNS